MKEYNLIESFFKNQNDYITFLVGLKERVIANDEGTCFAELKKLKGCFLYTLTWMPNRRYIGDYVKPFRASLENIKTFNQGCKILADRLLIYLESDDISLVPTYPPAFGYLTYADFN